jgi:hypothetical protein
VRCSSFSSLAISVEQNPRYSLYCEPLRVRDDVGVRVYRGLQILMPKQRLSGFQRLAIFMQKRRMGVPERVPRDPRLPDPIASRSELPSCTGFCR